MCSPSGKGERSPMIKIRLILFGFNHHQLMAPDFENDSDTSSSEQDETDTEDTSSNASTTDSESDTAAVQVSQIFVTFLVDHF